MFSRQIQPSDWPRKLGILHQSGDWLGRWSPKCVERDVKSCSTQSTSELWTWKFWWTIRVYEL